MAISKRAAEENLLNDILNALDITYEDEATKNKVADIARRGKALLAKFNGGEIDFERDMAARELLFSYCRYGRSNAIEQFEHDFSCQLTAYALERAVDNMPESGAQNESEV